MFEEALTEHERWGNPFERARTELSTASSSAAASAAPMLEPGCAQR